MSSDFQVRDFRCNNCGAPLEIPKNSNGKVVCPSCKTECIIEGIVKNTEIQAKENINSGVPLQASKSMLNQRVVDALTHSPYVPLDVLEKAVIVKEEHICVPAYLYYCNAMASFTYEAGNRREHKTAIERDGRTRVEREQYTEWTQMSSTASATATLIASGNREYGEIVQNLYMNLDTNKLIDVEDLEYPFDVETLSYNLPQSAAFNEYVMPHMEQLLEHEAVDSLQGKVYRNLSMGGSNVQKDEVIRIFLGIYHIVYEYNGTQYSLYVTGDGKNFIYDGFPVDEQRKQLFEQTQASMYNVKNRHNGFKTAAIICGILSLFTYGISLIGTIVCVIFYVKFKKEYDNATTKGQQELNAFMDQVNQVKQSFMQKGQPLQGIYWNND